MPDALIRQVPVEEGLELVPPISAHGVDAFPMTWHRPILELRLPIAAA